MTDATLPSVTPPGPTRRALGAFYTPQWATRHMVGMVDDLPSRVDILEPSGGDGAFVAALTSAGTDPDRITVWDINPAVREPLEALGVHCSIGDGLLRSDTGQFDLVIGNPPYLNKASDYIRANRRALAKPYRAIGVNDTYALFTYMAVNRLRPGGQLVFLVSDTFLTLGIHRRLREFLVANTRIDEIVLLPSDTFPDAAVHTAILKVTRTPAPEGHQVRFTDARACAAPILAGSLHRVPQAQLTTRPGTVFSFTPQDAQALDLVARHPRLMDYLDGGLGLHTKDNRRYLTALTGPRAVPASSIDWTTNRPYHKKGGAARWFALLDHAVAWSEPPPPAYGIPESALAGRDAAGHPRAGLVLSGISARLAARTMVYDALWESNKVFGLFPKDPDRYPVAFFIAILNSSTYTEIAKALNHTVSLQVRDLKSLPMLPFTQDEVHKLAELGDQACAWVRDGGSGEPVEQAGIDAIVDAAARR